MIARSYAPEFGRFLSVDPLADEFAGWSSYNYTFNNPLKFVDPDGRMPDCPDCENEQPDPKLNYHKITDQEKITAIITYLKSLNDESETLGDFRDIFDFTNERGFEIGTITGQGGAEILSGTADIERNELPVELHIGFTNDLISNAYTAFDLTKTAYNNAYQEVEQRGNRKVLKTKREVVLQRPYRTYRDDQGNEILGISNFPVLRIRQDNVANRRILIRRLFNHVDKVKE